MKKALFFILLACAAVAILYWSQSRTAAFSVSGILEADEIRIGSRVGGRVAEVLAREGDVVVAGQTLVRLEPFDLESQLAEAERLLEARRQEHIKLQRGPRSEEILQAQARRDQQAAVLARLEAGKRPLEIEVLEDRVEVARAELSNAQTNYDRIAQLQRAGQAAKQEYDDVSDRLAVAKARLSLAEHELELAREGTRPEEIAGARAALAEAGQNLLMLKTGYRQEEIAAASAEVERARAAADAIRQRLAELAVVAPLQSTVEALDLQPGDLIAPNAPVITLVDPARLYVRAYVPENRMNLRTGQEAHVQVDSFPGRRFRGRIVFVSRSGEFTPSNVQTPEERSRQVFRIKVDLVEGLDELRAGMAADVFFDSPVAAAASQP